MVYCEAKRILEAYEKKEGSIQSLINKSLYQKFRNSLTLLIMRTLGCQKLLKKIVKKSKMLERENFLGDKLAQLLTYDVLFGQGVRGKFKGTMKRNYVSLNESLDYYMKKYGCETREDLQKRYEDKSKDQQMIKPKYIFLNTLVKEKKELIDQLKVDKYVRVKNTVGTDCGGEVDEADSAKKLKTFIKGLKSNQFIKDEVIQNMLIFAPDSALNKSYHLFDAGHLMQIDKSSCLVPLALSPPENSHCIDAAAAPGNKTILLANILKNTGLIHAFDIDEPRVNAMQLSLKKHHVKNVRLKCQDFLSTDVEKYDRVTHIQLDPSCSGSGMTNRLKFGEHVEQELAKDTKRLWKLEGLQRRMLTHAMSFPAVERIVYSTCSIHEEENENVVRYALQNCENKFRLVHIFQGQWKSGRGLVKTDEDRAMNLDFCIRTSYSRNYTNGFFISCFEKIPDEEMDVVKCENDSEEQS